MDNKQSTKKFETQFRLVLISYVIGIVGMVAAFGDQNGTWLIASAIAFGSLLLYYKK